MPLYEYQCPGCGLSVTEARVIEERDFPTFCPLCSERMSRCLATGLRIQVRGTCFCRDEEHRRKPIEELGE